MINIDAAEIEMLGQEQVDCPVTHRFGPGIYIREVFMPKGAYVLGHRHKTTHLNVMLTGVIGLLNDDGTETVLTAPQTFIAQPGRKMAYIYEDVVWQNIHAADETDVEKLEDMFLDKSPAFLEKYQVTRGNYSEDQDDFFAALTELGLDPLTVREQSEVDDLMAFPPGDYKVMTGTSAIEGKGLFATGPFALNELIAPARLDGLRTLAGRYVNHSKTPNAEMVMDENGDIYLFSAREIEGCKGGALGEEITIDYRQALGLLLRSN